MTNTNAAETATPKPHTIRLIATCASCNETLLRTVEGPDALGAFPWYHAETGTESCTDALALDLS